MEKIWYVYLNNHHRGPFSTQEITTFILHQKIRPQSQIWREGLIRWMSLNEIPEFNKNKDQKKAPLPRADRFLAKQVKSILPQVNFSVGSIQKKTPSLFLLKFKNRKAFTLLWPLMFILPLILFFKGRTNDFHKASFIRPINMTLKDYNRLHNIARMGSVVKRPWELALSQDMTSLWMASPLSSTVEVRLKFSSIPQKVLSQEDVVFYTKGQLKDHLVEFKEFKLSKGTKIALGHYLVEVVEPVDQKTILAIQGNLEINKRQQWEFRKNIFLFSHLSSQDFSLQLKEYQKKLWDLEANHYQELLEKYSTLRALLENLENIFQQEMKRIQGGKDFQLFSERYTKEIGGILREITTDNYRLNGMINPKYSFLIEEYRHVTDLGREIGLLAVSMIDAIKKVEIFTEKQKITVISDYHLQILRLNESSLLRIKNLQKKVILPATIDPSSRNQ